ncbi:flagellar export chaperone FliS [Desulforamulus aquiferis]|uniref:Flagellar secretion chaperone FliS n=1 Tax=Desulforamulus aquiferis TaxID=1397668 RepID=A0AAW7ZG32_9FIRM|nr:flagellar export chaperone FliS [Desulforamulus aquiferis]MDO7788358.1 flagellar export chaperone FliS [Desulforamulus aquiferis]RYD03065.1 hypothetical protein N752_21890 [Desulforamulus aquiferis]
MSKHPYESYQQNSVLSAGPEELVNLLYNRLLKDLKLAIYAIERKDTQNTHNSLIHAQDILVHLMSTLNTELDVGKSLLLMYDYMNRRLKEANIEKNTEIIQEVIGYVEEIKDAWGKASRAVKTGESVG